MASEDEAWERMWAIATHRVVLPGGEFVVTCVPPSPHHAEAMKAQLTVELAAARREGMLAAAEWIRAGVNGSPNEAKPGSWTQGYRDACVAIARHLETAAGPTPAARSRPAASGAD